MVLTGKMPELKYYSLEDILSGLKVSSMSITFTMAMASLHLGSAIVVLASTQVGNLKVRCSSVVL